MVTTRTRKRTNRAKRPRSKNVSRSNKPASAKNKSTTAKIKQAYGNQRKKRRKPADSAAFWARLASTGPNNAELQLLGLITWLDLPYKFVGNAGLIIHGKCPDFVHTGGKKKLIELFGERWHPEADELKTVEFYVRAGYSTLIIWLKELNVKRRAELTAKLKEFDELED